MAGCHEGLSHRYAPISLIKDGRPIRAAVFAFSVRGVCVARQVMETLSAAQWRSFAPARLAAAGFEKIEGRLTDSAGPVFQWADMLIFVSSCGIAVRAIAPYVRDKTTDPAVLVIDDSAKYVVSLLSGHIGGANRWAEALAEILGAVAVVTTATDVNGKFSADAWAAEHGLHLSSRAAAKEVSAAILEGPVPLKSDFPIAEDLPPGVVPGESGRVGICVSWRQGGPFDSSLVLAPRVIRLGIGCRRGTGTAAIKAVVSDMLEEHKIDSNAVKCCASIDLKRDEPGLLAFCRERGWPIEFYSAAELQSVEGDFTSSEFVRSVTGVDNVCERAALLGAERLIVRKTARDGVTVAAAVERYVVTFS